MMAFFLDFYHVNSYINSEPFVCVVLREPFSSLYSVNSLICIYQNLLFKKQLLSLRLAGRGVMFVLLLFCP